MSCRGKQKSKKRKKQKQKQKREGVVGVVGVDRVDGVKGESEGKARGMRQGGYGNPLRARAPPEQQSKKREVRGERE